MTPPPIVPEQWKPLGRTFNTHYFLLSDDVLIVLPDKGLQDDGASARVNMDYQTAYARLVGKRCCVIVVIDSLTSQDSEARRIYAAGMNPALFYAVALIVSNPLARAIGSFFLGLTRPPVPTKLFETVEDAAAWVVTQRPAPKVHA
ncbi:MAG TPA: hypothetical protein VKI43_04050 [Vicinamibacterales bacterium]|nr:hypothetical protein [Vicinamibacterales bacterium]